MDVDTMQALPRIVMLFTLKKRKQQQQQKQKPTTKT